MESTIAMTFRGIKSIIDTLQ